MAKSSIPLGQWSGSDATDELRSTIESFNVAASEQTDEMLKLTRKIHVLTLVMILLVIGQLIVAIVALQ